MGEKGQNVNVNVNVVTPGQRLGSTTDYNAGVGTYIRAQYIYASRVGYKNLMAATVASADPVSYLTQHFKFKIK